MFAVRLLLRQQHAGARAYRYVASDMDGTALGPDHVLSDFTKRTLYALTQQRRVPFIFATGRQHADVAVVSQNLQQYFKETQQTDTTRARGGDGVPPPVYLITCNGAIAHNALTGEVALERCLPAHLVRELYHLVPEWETRINTNIIADDQWYCRMNWEEVKQFHKESGLSFAVLEKIPEKTVPASNASAPATSGKATPTEGDVSAVAKLFFTSWDKPLLDKLEAALQAKYSDLLTVNYSAYYCVDVTAKGVSKASALRQVLSRMPPTIQDDDSHASAELETRLRQTIAFGDDLNDAAMLQSVGRGFIMGNCSPRLKQACPELEVLGTNGDDAVAKKIREVFDLNV